MNVLARWLLGGIWGVWLTLPAIALARSASDLLILYGTCLAVAGFGVGLLWVATFGLRQLWHPERGGSRPGSPPAGPWRNER
jgi:hypothetical protein